MAGFGTITSMASTRPGPAARGTLVVDNAGSAARRAVGEAHDVDARTLSTPSVVGLLAIGATLSEGGNQTGAWWPLWINADCHGRIGGCDISNATNNLHSFLTLTDDTATVNAAIGSVQYFNELRKYKYVNLLLCGKDSGYNQAAIGNVLFQGGAMSAPLVVAAPECMMSVPLDTPVQATPGQLVTVTLGYDFTDAYGTLISNFDASVRDKVVCDGSHCILLQFTAAATVA